MSAPPRVALFGLLGSGNIGNHGSFESMLEYLRADHPEAEITCVCAGPADVERRYGLPSMSITWYGARAGGRSGLKNEALKAFGKVADVVRTFRWVRRCDVVIIPGMGVLEATLPIRPWGFPYALFLMSFWARVCGTKVAFVSVGANKMRQPVTRWFIKHAAKLAHYRSFRDAPAREAIRQAGVDTSNDLIFPDLAFALPDVTSTRSESKSVGVGVMDYSGTYLDRRRAERIHTMYVSKIIAFVRWLVDNDYRVQLFTGDPADEIVVTAVLRDIRDTRPHLADTKIIAEPAESLGDLMRQMSAVDAVVATRYHNVLSALKMAKPTISISYASKNDVLMEQMGLGSFCQPIQSLDVPKLIDQFRTIENADEQLAAELRRRSEHNAMLLRQQNAVLSATLFDADQPTQDASLQVRASNGRFNGRHRRTGDHRRTHIQGHRTRRRPRLLLSDVRP